MACEIPLTKPDGEPFIDATLYQSTVRALQYVVLTRPEIVFSINKIGQYFAIPTINH